VQVGKGQCGTSALEPDSLPSLCIYLAAGRALLLLRWLLPAAAAVTAIAAVAAVAEKAPAVVRGGALAEGLKVGGCRLLTCTNDQ
jgi:hypothetical protein